MSEPCSYILARAKLVEQLTLSAMPGPLCCVDPSRVESAAFVESLQVLDHALYEESGLQAPRWAFYDCGIFPGLALGLGVVRDGEGPAAVEPLTMLIALPQLQEGHWLFYDLSGPIGHSDEADALREKTLRAAVAATEARGVTSVTQWSSEQLDIHTRVATLEVVAAWLPSHDIPASLVFRHTDSPLVGARERRVDVSDTGALRDLQVKIEAGHRVQILGPQERGSTVRTLLMEAR